MSSPSRWCQKISTSVSSSSKVRRNHSTPQSTPLWRVIRRRLGPGGGGNQLGGEVPGAHVLGQGAGDVAGDGFFQQVECVGHVAASWQWDLKLPGARMLQGSMRE